MLKTSRQDELLAILFDDPSHRTIRSQPGIRDARTWGDLSGILEELKSFTFGVDLLPADLMPIDVLLTAEDRNLSDLFDNLRLLFGLSRVLHRRHLRQFWQWLWSRIFRRRCRLWLWCRLRRGSRTEGLPRGIAGSKARLCSSDTLTTEVESSAEHPGGQAGRE
ncbi:hypothetical protein [Corynebacterium sp. S5S1]|uniref:hypothetical protein n=1 Tax=Corynebacterium sp. S5S1 TaxID=1881620 RepID=UPI00257B8A57|nr:hypothetical protein [Corynebacterium sp. S5S1]